MFNKLIKFIMNITKFHKIPIDNKHDSDDIVFPKIGLLYNLGNQIVLFRFPDDDRNFPASAFGVTIEDFSPNAKILFNGTFDGSNYVDNNRGKSISELKLEISKDDTNIKLFGDINGEPISALLGVSSETPIPIAGSVIGNVDGNFKFVAIMNETYGYGYYSEIN